jgi:hypothetical protein
LCGGDMLFYLIDARLAGFDSDVDFRDASGVYCIFCRCVAKFEYFLWVQFFYLVIIQSNSLCGGAFRDTAVDAQWMVNFSGG